MRLPYLWLAAVALFGILTATLHAGGYPDPARFEKDIAAFEKADAAAMPEPGQILCIGSSSMRMWHKTIKQDLAPLPVIPRGFGGSNMNDVLHFFDRAILPYKPRAVMLYEGDNDIASGIAPADIHEVFKTLVGKLHAALPATRLYVICAKPSIKRENLWPKYIEVNGLLKATCEADPLLTFIDVAPIMMGADGKPKPEIFTSDNLHMNAEGYKLWTTVIRPILMAGEDGK